MYPFVFELTLFPFQSIFGNIRMMYCERQFLLELDKIPNKILPVTIEIA